MKNKKILIAIVGVLVSVIGLVTWLIWGNTALMVSEFEISSDKIPEGFDGYKIVQVSDLHNAEFGEENCELLELVRRQNPDIIVITGDLIDSNHTDIDVAISFCEKAVEIAPIYYVNGNHEARISGYDELEAAILECGVVILNDELTTLNVGDEYITLIGVQDPDFIDYGWFDDYSSDIVDTTIKSFDLDDDSFVVLLSHRPELFDVYVNNEIDLTFTGHAHGGQIRIPFIGGLYAPNQGFFPEYDAGLYEENDSVMLLSRGLGNSIFPLRVNNRPEVVVAVLKSA
ncbi:MAG: metallophosphoesterase [Clostridia bacterium]